MKKILFFASVLLLNTAIAQNILIVDNNFNIDTSPAHVFSTLTAAVTAASNGDIIYIQPSATGYGAITINKSLTLIGKGHAPELNNGEASVIGNVTISANNVKITGLFVSGLVSSTANVNNGLIEDCHITSGVSFNLANVTNMTIRGNLIKNGIFISNNLDITITNNLIQNIGFNAFSGFNDTTIFNNNVIIADQSNATGFIFANANNLVCQNNIWLFTNNAMDRVDQNASGTPIIHNNSLTYHYGSTTILPLNGNNNLNNQNPFFVNITANNPYYNVAHDYNLGASSAGNDAGADGNDVGIYNGFYDFDMRGYPTELPYLLEMSISNNMIPAGANLNVNLKANANKSN